MEAELGVLLAVSGGVMVGVSMAPLNYLRKWRWENAWIVFSVIALVLMPWGLAFWRLPDLLAVYSSVNFSDFKMPFLFGAGWGVAQVLFGLAVVRIGMALSFAITIGLSAALGALVPILFKHPRVLATEHGSFLLLGLLLMIAGVYFCSWAGRRRESGRKGETAGSGERSYVSGLLLAIGAGLLAPMLNYALAFGDNFILEAIHHHAARADAPYAVWPIALAGGAIPNIAYAASLVYSNRSWANFLPVWPEVLIGAIMGFLWMGSVAIYGTATTFLGLLGASIGWSIYQIVIIVTANVSGWIAGEWKGIDSHSKLALWSGLVLLCAAVLAITYGNR